ncbi:uncharacterized protein CIMG_13692 [Coccidioides immitis RS]|nr:uncharacterized protein CIMG_13692 [Coccidioides immitis RS]EAS32211.3 hypothetical protein CIMG_13692 [Coccidioides immitis RS]
MEQDLAEAAARAQTDGQPPCLFVGQNQLAPYAHSPQSRRLLAQPGRNVEFVLGRIFPYQINMHRQSYINAILIQSRGRTLHWSSICNRCTEMEPMAPFPLCRRAYGHFGGACGNCKWPDYASRCSLHGRPESAVRYDDRGPSSYRAAGHPHTPGSRASLGLSPARPILLLESGTANDPIHVETNSPPPRSGDPPSVFPYEIEEPEEPEDGSQSNPITLN